VFSVIFLVTGGIQWSVKMEKIVQLNGNIQKDMSTKKKAMRKLRKALRLCYSVGIITQKISVGSIQKNFTVFFPDTAL
jgi:hypothetical protein